MLECPVLKSVICDYTETVDLQANFPDTPKLKEVFRETKDHAAIGGYDYLHPAMRSIALGEREYLLPEPYQDDVYSQPMRWHRDGVDVSLDIWRVGAETTDVLYDVSNYGLILARFATGLNLRPRWLNITYGSLFYGEPDLEMLKMRLRGIPTGCLTIDSRLAGRWFGAFLDCQWSDVRVVPHVS